MLPCELTVATSVFFATRNAIFFNQKAKQTKVMRAKGTRWSPAEDDALLRAWADVAERRVKNLHKAFVAVCAAAALPTKRSMTSLSQRRTQYVRMYKVARTFHRHRQSQPGSTPDDTSQATAADYSSDSWFELTVDEQRRWFASLNTGTYTFGEMTQEAFDRVEALVKRQEVRTNVRRAAPYTQPRKSKQQQQRASYAGGCNTEVDACSVGEARDDFKEEPNPEAVAGAAAKFKNPPADLENDDSSSGSSTESDDEILTWWGEDDEAAFQRSVNETSVKAELGQNSKTLSAGGAFLKKDTEQQSSSSHQVDKVDPDFLELASILETQSRHIGNLFRQTKRRRQEESRGRQYIWKKARLGDNEKNQVFQDIARRDQELQREHEDWDEERRAMKRELTKLRERNAVRPPPREASDSSAEQ